MVTEPVKTALEKSAVKTDTATKDEAARASSVVERAVIADPVLMNTMNAEPWWQSGVGFFGTGGLLWAIGVIAVQAATHGLEFQNYDYDTMIAAIGALVSAAGVLYRRFWPGLKPMFHWW